MESKKIKIDFDFNKILNYFKSLPQDMMIAHATLGLGIILIIVGLLML